MVLNILVVHQYYLEPDDPGGSRFNEMAKSWTDAGHKVEVLCGTVSHATGEILPEYVGRKFTRKQDGNVDVQRCYVSTEYGNGFTGRLKGYLSFMCSSLWAALFRTLRKPDVIVVTSPPLFLGITGLLVKLFRGIPFVFEIRDLWPESAIDSGVLTNKYIIRAAFLVESLIYKMASQINVLTPAFRKALIEKKGIDPDKIIYIPNAADFSLSDTVARDFDSQAFRASQGWQDRIVLTYVGAHGVANALDQLLDAAELVAPIHPHVLFVLIGAGMTKPDLVKEATERKLHNVSFLPPVAKREVFKYILASDFGVSVLKRVDTFKTIYSNKTFDYMACRKPVLLGIDGVSRQLVEVAQCGRFIEPERPADFLRVITELLQQPRSAWETQGNNGRRYAELHFDRSRLSKQYLTHLEALVD